MHISQKVITEIYLKHFQIDWTEPWLIGLLVFHAAVTTLTIVTRHHGNFQGIFFFLLRKFQSFKNMFCFHIQYKV